jgi:hypothetical protein
VSLVGPEVGSGANQTRTLVLKQTLKSANQPEETIELSKALEQITVTLSLEEFLRKFFGMWSDDAEMLTKLMGFETEYEAYKREQETNGEEPWDYSKYLEEKVSQFKIIKSMNEGAVTEITKSAFDQIVALQQKHETALVEHINKKVKQMEELELAKSALVTKETELATQVELVKSLEGKVAELEQSISVFKAAEEQAKFDAFAAQLKGLVAEDKFDTVVKGLYALHNVDAEAAATSIEALKSAQTNKQVEQDGLTVEQSHGESTDPVELAKARDAQLIQQAHDKLKRK